VKTVPLPYDRGQLEERLGPSWKGTLSELYRGMLLGRVLDQRMLALQRQGRVGFYGPTMGHEAVNAAAAGALDQEDWVFPGLREQLVALLRGHPLELYLDHLFANEADPARGRQMPCHPSARDVRYVSMSSNIGTQIPQAVGTAWAMRRKGKGTVAAAFFGDGATSSSEFHAGLNFAAVLEAPVLFVCANNQWAISLPTSRQSAVKTLAEKARAYGMPGTRVDGTDPVAVLTELSSARREIAAGKGPRLVETVVYRLTPHSSSDDPTRYQPPGWAEEAWAHDPVARTEALLETLGVVDAKGREAMHQEIEERIRKAVQLAEPRSPPGPESLFEDTYRTPFPPLTEERDRFDMEQGGHFP
jgi:pyruvate dehydrogenase E1 component alpha subunit/2-oxoisovalerate dehydrogenase E1 component alpha subunit